MMVNNKEYERELLKLLLLRSWDTENGREN